MEEDVRLEVVDQRVQTALAVHTLDLLTAVPDEEAEEARQQHDGLHGGGVVEHRVHRLLGQRLGEVAAELRMREMPHFALHRRNFPPLFYGVSEIFLRPRKIPP